MEVAEQLKAGKLDAASKEKLAAQLKEFERQLAESRATGVQRLCLHASSVSIPIAGGMRRFEAPLPEDFAAAWRLLSAANNANDSR